VFGAAFWASAAVAAPAPAEELTLADLIGHPEATFRSHDGRVEFSDFEFEAARGVFAFPENDSVRVIPAARATGGFVLEGAYQALNGVRMAGTLSFTATAVDEMPFNLAWLQLGTPAAFGFSVGPSARQEPSYVSLIETLTALEGGATFRLATLHDAAGDGTSFVSSPLNPDLFGSPLRVSQEIELQSVRGDGPSVAILSSHAFGLTVVPEPGTALLLLAAGCVGAAKLRRRRSR